MTEKLKGGCLCGNVIFEMDNNFDTFYFCHCKQCQHLTGSAFATNIFTAVDNITWLKGSGSIQNYHHPSRSFSYAFCKDCGSALPFITKSKDSLLVPAGSLMGEPNIKVKANIFNAERSAWLDEGLQAKCLSGFPDDS